MTKPLTFDVDALEELTAAEAWYESSAGLGLDFTEAISEATHRIARRPHSFPCAVESDIRRCPVKRFPYSLFYLELRTEFRVLAVAHDRRQPGYWRFRR